MKRDGMPDNCNGFTLLEVLCALLCACMVFSLCAACLQSAKNIVCHPMDRQMDLGVLQLRETAAGYQKAYVTNQTLYLENAAGECCVEFHNGRIVKRPGYVIYLEGVDDGYFEESSGITLVVVQDQKTYRWQICQSS